MVSRREPRRVFSLRLGAREVEIVEAAARNRGVSFSEFLRITATDAARKELAVAAPAVRQP